VEAAGEEQMPKTIARYGRVDLLCIDELGSMDSTAVAPNSSPRS
jgi:DNA replication protein DnaC